MTTLFISDLHLEAVRRNGLVVRVDGSLVLKPDDQLTVIGPLDGLPDTDDLARILVGSSRSSTGVRR